MASRGLLAAVRKLQAPRVKYQPGLAKDNLIPANRWNIVRGDKVEMLSGVEKGKQGIVNKVIRKKNQIIVEGFNVRISCACMFLLCIAQKQVVLEAREGLPEKTVTRSEPIHVTNAQLVCPETGKPTAVKRQFLEDGTKVRVAKVSGAIIPKPEVLKQRRRLKSTVLGPRDTDQTDAHSITCALTYKLSSSAGARSENEIYSRYLRARQDSTAACSTACIGSSVVNGSEATAATTAAATVNADHWCMHTNGAHYGAQAWRPTAHFAAVIAAGEKKAKCFFAVTEHYMDTLLLLLLLGSQGKSRNDQ
eukprot:9471-Heterococcus_DN1.PRE.1